MLNKISDLFYFDWKKVIIVKCDKNLSTERNVTPYKVYFEDIGIRNAILNFREVDETDLIENIEYNELRYCGFNIDIVVATILSTNIN